MPFSAACSNIDPSRSPSLFLFDQAWLKPHDLPAFAHVSSDPRAQHYSKVIQRQAAACTDRTRVRNQRYAALRALQKGTVVPALEWCYANGLSWLRTTKLVKSLKSKRGVCFTSSGRQMYVKKGSTTQCIYYSPFQMVIRYQQKAYKTQLVPPILCPRPPPLLVEGDYFSDEQMRIREPLLYEQYIGQYLTDEEVRASCGVALTASALLFSS